MVELFTTYGPKLKLYSVQDRPNKHSCLINGNILYEDYHASDDDYLEATVIENVDDENISKYINNFEYLKQIATPEDTVEKINGMRTIH